MFAWLIAKPEEPAACPGETQQGKRREGRTPTEANGDRSHHDGSKTTAEMRTHKEDSLGRAPLPRREPTGQGSGDCRPRPRFSGAEESTENYQRREIPSHRGQAGED